ncbi:DUF2180 family protein [Streptomyces kasugaensis]|jgi:hypothetical protein|uniref:DUF2180 family protein n=1 Tax=Streptomyces kasugaensis TaxID=1946 RepID=A0A4Q9HYK7_STRKA|nr:DUF2180 family protein [Streptomyces sp. SID7805]TBO60155.1 DUF2180 family protein [Streptomyces kasugaensis]WSK16572.1 DUF2180 family protein [Streptomyces celluloflavus]
MELLLKCYDCCLADRNGKVPVGICCRCGLAVCAEHAHVAQSTIHRMAGMGKSTSDLPARRVLCQTCHGAERSF